MKLSIIIPYFNAEPYTSELLDTLSPQMRKGIECILIDDGSKEPFKTHYKWVKVFRKNNGGAASARNMGIDKAKGEYLSFIDADDLVPEYYVDKLMETINTTDADVIDYSWKSLDHHGVQHNFKLKNDHDFLSNPSLCTRCFKKSYIGSVRLNEKKDATEDEDFSRKLGYLEDGDFKHVSITDYMYYYRTAVEGSNVKRFKQGLTNTKRIAYYYPKVTQDMDWLLDEIKREDETHEVFLITTRCEIPELKRYCKIVGTDIIIWTHFLRGEPYSRVKIIPVPYDIVIYTENIRLNGIATFIKNFCEMFSDKNVLVLYEKKHCDISFNADERKNDKTIIHCNTLIINSLYDKLPPNVVYRKTVQMVHACKRRELKIPQSRDYIVNVSEAAQKTWGSNDIVIHNPQYITKKSLLLVSATRIGASDKGQQDKRMIKLCDMLNAAKIDFTWLNFSEGRLSNPPKNFINCPPTHNVVDIMKRADYSVLLSDNEAYSYSILESLSVSTCVLSCPFESAFEQGLKDGINGYIIPFDMNFDVHKLLNIPVFDYDYSSENEKIREQWLDLMSSMPQHKDVVTLEVLQNYRDLKRDQYMTKGMRMEVSKERADFLVDVKKLCRIV